MDRYSMRKYHVETLCLTRTYMDIMFGHGGVLGNE